MVPQRACERCVESVWGGDVAENGPKAPLKNFLCQAGRCLRVFLVWFLLLFLLFSGWFAVSVGWLHNGLPLCTHPKIYFWRCRRVAGWGSLHPATRRAVNFEVFGLVGGELANQTPNFPSFSGGWSVWSPSLGSKLEPISTRTEHSALFLSKKAVFT